MRGGIAINMSQIPPPNISSPMPEIAEQPASEVLGYALKGKRCSLRKFPSADFLQETWHGWTLMGNGGGVSHPSCSTYQLNDLDQATGHKWVSDLTFVM